MRYSVLLLLSFAVGVFATRPPIVSIDDVYISQEPHTSGSPTEINATFAHVVTPANAAEYNCIDGTRVFVISGSKVLSSNTVHVYDIVLGSGGKSEFAYIGGLDLTLPGEMQQFGEPNSCTAFDGKIFVVLSGLDSLKGTNTGKLMVFNTQTLALLDSYDTGYNPDHALQNYQKTYVVTADEGEPPLYTDARMGIYEDSENQYGGTTIVHLATKSVCRLYFNFGYTLAEYRAKHIHIQQDSEASIANDPSRDIEPEYVGFDPLQEDVAYLVAQEANMMIEVNLTHTLPCTLASRVMSIRPLGRKNYGSYLIQPTDQKPDNTGNLANSDLSNLAFRTISNLYGLYQPDSFKGYTVNGQTYFITANEGDSKVAAEAGAGDEIEAGDLNKLTDIVTTANQFNPYDYTNVINDEVCGRLTVMSNEGKTTTGNQYESFYTYGGRGFSIFKFTPTTSELVFDSGAFTERTVAAFLLSKGSVAQRDQYRKRLDRKGTEPEGMAVMHYQGRVIACVTFERAGTVGLFDVTDPLNVYFLTYITHPELFNPEAVNFVAKEDSPSGKILLVVNGEGDASGSHRLMVFELDIHVEATQGPTLMPATESPTLAPLVITNTTFAPRTSGSGVIATTVSMWLGVAMIWIAVM